MTINTYPMPLLRPEVERDSFGRYILPNPDEPGVFKSYTRATTMAGAIADKYNIAQWQRRMVVLGIASEPTLLDEFDVADFDPADSKVKEQLTDLADKAHAAAGGNDAADRGTTLHYFTEAVDGGHLTLDEVPGEYRNEVTAYVRTLAKAGITIVPDMVERILLNTVVNVAGTADRQHVIMPNGARLVADVKTGKDLSWSWNEIAMQLAIYAHADFMLAHDDEGQPYWDGVPEVDQRYALVMHAPVDKGKCKLYLVDLTAGWAAVELALEVRAYRSRRNLALPLDVAAWLPEGKSVADVALPMWGVTAPSASVTELSPVPVESSPETNAVEPTPLDEARRLFDTTVIEAAAARAARSRRNSQQKRADEAAELVDDGVPTVHLYEQLTRELRSAYKLDVLPNTAPAPTKAAETPSSGDGDPFSTVAEAAPTEAVAEVVTTKYGTVVSKGDPRLIECTETIDRAEPTRDGMSAVYAEYADVWEQFHAARAEARIDVAADEVAREAQGAPDEETANAAPEVVASDTLDPRFIAGLHTLDPRLVAALDACDTAEDMGGVYADWTEVYGPDSWLDSYTEYGKAALAAKS